MESAVDKVARTNLLNFLIDEFADFAERKFGDSRPSDEFVERAEKEVVRQGADAAGRQRRPFPAHGAGKLLVIRVPRWKHQGKSLVECWWKHLGGSVWLNIDGNVGGSIWLNLGGKW